MKWVGWDRGVQKQAETFILVKPGADPPKLSGVFPTVLSERFGKKEAVHTRYHLQPLKRIHLYSGKDFGIAAEEHGGEPLVHGDIESLYLFGILGLVILAIACVNFVNLTTARATIRAREVALRRTVGAVRGQLVRQFLGESVALALGSFVLAVVFVYLALPSAHGFLGRNLTIGGYGQLAAMLIVTLVVGLLAGCYPAFVLSGIRPVDGLKEIHSAARGSGLRRALVFAHFAAAIVLMAATWGVYSQQAFLRGRHPGFNTEQIMELPIFGLSDGNSQVNAWRLKNVYNNVKDAFVAHPNVLRATSSRGPMGEWAALERFKHDLQDPWFADLMVKS